MRSGFGWPVGAVCSAPGPARSNLLRKQLQIKRPRKHALLVGISNYCRGDGSECGKRKKYWWDLNSEPDVDALKQVLIQKFGFTESEIKVLKTRPETTHESIRKMFKSFLIDQTREGDTVYFHYSGHGGTVPD